MLTKFMLNDVPHAAGLIRDKGTLAEDLKISVQQQIAWKSSVDAQSIRCQEGESTWASNEWGKIRYGKVTLFHDTSPYLLPTIMKEGIKTSHWIPIEELDEEDEPQVGVWLTTTPYYAFFYGDVALRVIIPADWIDRVMGDEIWLDRNVPPEMIVESKTIDEWRAWK